MKYTKEERPHIGREIYTHELTIGQAAEKYQINNYTARDYMRLYRDSNNLGPMDDYGEEFKLVQNKKKEKYTDLDNMTRDELIDEVIKARVEAERTKKGYSVKGGGLEKVFMSISEMNSK